MRHYRGPVHFPETLAPVEPERPRVLFEDEQAQGVETPLAGLFPGDGEELGSKAHATKPVEQGKRAHVEGVRDLQPLVRLQDRVDGLVWFCRVGLYGIGTELSDHLPLSLGDYAVRVGEVALLAGVADGPDLDWRQPGIVRGQGAPHVIHNAV